MTQGTDLSVSGTPTKTNSSYPAQYRTGNYHTMPQTAHQQSENLKKKRKQKKGDIHFEVLLGTCSLFLHVQTYWTNLVTEEGKPKIRLWPTKFIMFSNIFEVHCRCGSHCFCFLVLKIRYIEEYNTIIIWGGGGGK